MRSYAEDLVSLLPEMKTLDPAHAREVAIDARCDAEVWRVIKEVRRRAMFGAFFPFIGTVEERQRWWQYVFWLWREKWMRILNRLRG